MKGLLHKKLTKKGFTLAELLIVVAILAILVAVSIPIFTTKLADAKKATDEANLRACKALVANAIITEEYPDESWMNNGTYKTAMAVFDAENGCLVPSVVGIKGYGKGSNAKGFTNNMSNPALKYQANITSVENGCLYITVYKENNDFIIQWGPVSL